MLALSSFLSSCSKDNNDFTPSKKITGVWNARRAIEITSGMGMTSSDTTDFASGSTVDFRADGTVVGGDGDQGETGNWNMSNNKLFITNISELEYPLGYDIPVLTDRDLHLAISMAQNGVSFSYTLEFRK